MILWIIFMTERLKQKENLNLVTFLQCLLPITILFAFHSSPTSTDRYLRRTYLRKRAPLSRVILNFALSEMASKNPGPSLILDCDIAQIISSHTWFLDDRLSPIFDKVWRDPEYELVLLPCCHNTMYTFISWLQFWMREIPLFLFSKYRRFVRQTTTCD